MTNDITPMTPEAAQEWIDALEGPYAGKKGKAYLCKDGAMCCLGVLADIRDDWDDCRSHKRCLDGSAIFPVETRLVTWGISHENADTLVYLNDHSDTFAPVIAEIKRMFIDKAS